VSQTITALSVLAFFLPALFFAGCTRREKTLAEEVGVRIAGWEKLKLAPPKTVSVGGHSVDEYNLKHEGVEARLRIIQKATPQMAEQMRKQKLFTVKSLFEEARSPYPGAVTNTIERPPQLLPKVMNEDSKLQDLTRIQVPANSRKSMGVSTEADFFYRHTWLMIYCRDRQRLVEVDAYTPRSRELDWDKWLSPAECLGEKAAPVKSQDSPASILIFKKDRQFVLRKCDGEKKGPEGRRDCRLRDTSLTARVPLQELTRNFKAALALPYDLDPAMAKKNDYSKEGTQEKPALVEKNKVAVRRIFKQLHYWIESYKAGPDLAAALHSLEQKYQGQEHKAVRDVSLLVDRLIGATLLRDGFEQVVSGPGRESFDFSILAALLNQPVLSAKFKMIPAGKFRMGSLVSEAGRWPDEIPHQVEITQSFEMQETEVTQADWFNVMGYNPSGFKLPSHCPEDFLEIHGVALCPKHPVEMVSWQDVQEFISRVNRSSKNFIYRLPSEAEWEYAARGGSQAAYSFGDDPALLRDYAWYFENSEKRTHAAGLKKPNAYGLYDMHGNVFEWVQDWFAPYKKQKTFDPVGPRTGTMRVFRGGAWNRSARPLRAAFRRADFPHFHVFNLGFRLARDPR